MFRVLFSQSGGRWPVLLISAILVLLFSAAAMATDVAALFQEARTVAAQLSRDAVTMESFTRSNLTWQSHATQVTQIREHINRAGSILSEMHAARAGASPGHQEAIDRITPVLKELASNTESIINHLNQTPRHLTNPTYQQYLASNMELSRELAASIRDTVDYDATRARMEELQAKLEK
jgi:hypothetical protein